MEEYEEEVLQKFFEDLADLAEREGIPLHQISRWLRRLDGTTLSVWFSDEYYEADDE